MEKISTETFDTCKDAARAAAKYVAQNLQENSGGDNLLLVSGGSSVDVAYWASSSLDVNTTNSVTLAQVDERYGPVGHDDSNWKALLDKGLQPQMFRNAIELLQLGTTPSDVSVSYNRALSERLDNVGYRIAILGIGDDGHIAGMKPLPLSDFDKFIGGDLVVDYKAEDYTRITVTARTLLQMDLIVLYACGDNKKQALDKIYDLQPLNEYPAQMLKQCKKVKVFLGNKAE